MNDLSFGPLSGGDALSDYITKYRRSDLPPLMVGAPLDLYPSLPSPTGFRPQVTWEHPWPFGDHAGVYLIYSEFLELLYIGKASMNRCLGQRLYEYFGSGNSCDPKAEWLQSARFVITIAVPEDMPFEAPAIEEFLIRKLLPKSNGTGR